MDTDLPLKDIPFPEEALDQFAKKFKGVAEVMKSPEWSHVYHHYYNFNDLEKKIVFDEVLENYTLQQQIEEIKRCASSFEYFCTKYVKIAHPTRGLIRCIPFKYQRRVIKSYENNRFNILSKFRQGGLTMISVAWATWRCLFKMDQRIMIVSKSDREAIAAGAVAKIILDYLPTWMKPILGKDNEHERQFEDTGSFLWCYTVEACRGKSITVLIIDEAAFIQNMSEHWGAIYPTIATGGAACVISTPAGIGNWYEQTYREAERGENKFNIVDMDYWEHPDYNNPDWVADQRANLTDQKWAQEFLRSFLGSGCTFIPAGTIREIEDSVRNNTPARIKFEQFANDARKSKYSWEKGALWWWKDPTEGHDYILAADCAEGVGDSGDNSCFQIIDEATLEQVAEFYSNTITPQVFAQVIFQMGIYYNTALVVIENMSVGLAVIQALESDLGYENMYRESKGKNTIPGIKTTRQNRPVFLETLQNRLLNGSVKINSPRFVEELNTFEYNSTTKKPEARRKFHDDAIMALSIALYVRDLQIRSAPVGEAAAMSQLLKSEQFEEIKREILEGSDEDWFEKQDQRLIQDDDGYMMNVLNAHRKRNKLLMEFSW